MNLRAFSLGLVCLLMSASIASAQFKLPNLNPFATTKKPVAAKKNVIRRTGRPRAATRTISDAPGKAKSKSWIPDLRPGWMKPKRAVPRRAKYAKRQPSTLQSIGTNTSRFVNSLNPFRKRSRAARPRTLRPPTGSRMVSPRTQKKKTTSYFPNIFGTTPKPTPRKPRTPIEFLKQPRP